MTISNQMTVVALVNGMIGGIILIMPIIALHTGYLLIAPISLIMGFFSYFSCLLCLRHLKHFQDLDEAILYHFKKRGYKIFYDITIVISMSVLLILYFDLICQQWSSMTAQSRLIPILNALVLFPIVYIMRKFDFGASLLGYGILSIIGYCIFLVWMYIDSPQGQQKIQPVQSQFSQLAAALAQGFAIQTFFIPVLMKNNNKRLHKKLLFLTYAIGIGVYSYIAYCGAYGIVNRKIGDQDPQTVQDYFGKGQWQVITLQLIYLVHLYSAFPEFLLVAMKRFFSIMSWQSKEAVTIKEVLYVSITIFVSLALSLTGISVDILIQFNGAFVSFVFIYVIPIALHVKCVYFSSQVPHIEMNDEKQLPKMKSDNDIDNENKPSSQDMKGEIKQQIPQKQIPDQNEKNMKSQTSENVEIKQSKPQQIVDIPCNCTYKYKIQEYAQIVIMVLMVLSGLFVMGKTLADWIIQKK